MGYFDEAIAKQNNDELSHYGILGQKWGIRRFQDKYGRLTEEGKKRLRESFDGQFVDKKGEKGRVSEERSKYFNAAVRAANGGKEFEGDGYEAWQLVGERKASLMWNAFLDKYGSAMIKDLKLKETDDAKRYVDALLEKYKYYEFDMINNSTGKSQKKYMNREDLDDMWANPFTSYDSYGHTYTNKRKIGTYDDSDDREYDKGSKGWNKSSTYTKDFLNYLKREDIKPEEMKDPELMSLIQMEYEEFSGKNPRKES